MNMIKYGELDFIINSFILFFLKKAHISVLSMVINKVLLEKEAKKKYSRETGNNYYAHNE